MASSGRTVLAQLSCLLHRVPLTNVSARCPIVRNQFYAHYQRKCHASTSADEIMVAETTADKREKHLHLEDGSAYGERKEVFISPELLPPMGTRSKLKDYLERRDCFNRRRVMQIPEFYVGSIMAVTMADKYAKGKTNRFVGICTRRGGFGLGATFVLRNVINDQGVEICYEMYSPLIQKIEVLKLEKRLDSDLKYLQDALPEYSTVDPNMVPIKHPPGKPVPVNPIKVTMKPKPWYKRWERAEMLGIDLSILSEEKLEHAKQWWLPEYKRMDLLQQWKLPEDISQTVKREVEQHENELENDRKKK